VPLPEEIKNAIIDDLKEDRLDYEEIAAKRLGDAKKKVTISRVAAAAGLSRKDRRGKSRRSYVPKVSAQKPATKRPVKIETFGAETRLLLIDEAITIHKELLAGCTDPYKMDKWSAALERLLEQRRQEEPKENGKEEELLTKFTDALESHAISAKTSGCLPGLPEDSANPDVRLGEERKD
jgi:hypothetical protein